MVSGRVGELKIKIKKSLPALLSSQRPRALSYFSVVRTTSVVKFGVTYSLAFSSKSRASAELSLRHRARLRDPLSTGGFDRTARPENR